MKHIDIHNFILAIIGLIVGGLTFGSPVAIAAVCLVLQFPLVTRYLATRNRDVIRFVINETVLVALGLAAWIAIRK
jgi:hypothetical protein